MAEEKTDLTDEILKEAIISNLQSADEYEIGSDERDNYIKEANTLMKMRVEWSKNEYEYSHKFAELDLREREYNEEVRKNDLLEAKNKADVELRKAEIELESRKNDISEAQVRSENRRIDTDNLNRRIQLGIELASAVLVPIGIRIFVCKYVKDETVRRMIFEQNLSWRTAVGKDVVKQFERFEQELLSTRP